MTVIEKALSYYGQREKDGAGSNPVILEIIKRWARWVTDDSKIAWCSIFVNDVCAQLGLPHTRKLNAKSWLEIGIPVELEDANIGDVVVFWRESINSWKGHVGFYIRHDDNVIWVLGGNQENAVNIKPYSRKRLLGVRKLK